jgi:hypothetical protein
MERLTHAPGPLPRELSAVVGFQPFARLMNLDPDEQRYAGASAGVSVRRVVLNLCYLAC